MIYLFNMHFGSLQGKNLNRCDYAYYIVVVHIMLVLYNPTGGDVRERAKGMRKIRNADTTTINEMTILEEGE